MYEESTKQIGASTLQKHLSESIFFVVIGNNDIFDYFNSKDLQKKNTPQQFVKSMASSLKAQLQVNTIVVYCKLTFTITMYKSMVLHCVCGRDCSNTTNLDIVAK